VAVKRGLDIELKRALVNHEIVPYLQPLVDLRSRRTIGFEILARWLHPARQMIHPAEFIPVAEKAGLIGVLSEALLEHTCSAASAVRADFQLALNLSPLQLRDPALPKRLQGIAEGAGVSFGRLSFEITESSFVDDFDLAFRILGNLKALGARLALDDFGTGYSGLRHLQMLPFDTIKIDAGFVRTMTTRTESRKIVAAVVGLSQNLGLALIAEGIESQGQLDMLRCLGCSVGQGWLFGRPVPAAQAFTEFEEEEPPEDNRAMTHVAEQVALRLEALPNECLAQLRTLYVGTLVGLGFLDPHLRYVAVNERLAEMHGLPVGAHIGRTVNEILPDDLVREIEPRLQRALAGETITNFVIHGSPEAGQPPRLLQACYQPVRDVTGEIFGVSVAVIDRVEHTASLPSNKMQPFNLVPLPTA
jgi:EAL domain-containing protein (putative c-di-GMP-specific phosphodiesterase class I)